MLREAAELEEASDGTFLETYFTVEHDRIEYRLKNANEGDVKKVWRYQSWESYSPSEQKRRTLVATLKKVAAMASSKKEMMNSAWPSSGTLFLRHDDSTCPNKTALVS